MKFLCPSCRRSINRRREVAGRSVRMKCRKCGYVIHVSKAVTDGTATEASDRPSSEWPPSGPGMSVTEVRSSVPPPQRLRRTPPPVRTAPTPKVANRPGVPSRRCYPIQPPPPARAATRSVPQAPRSLRRLRPPPPVDTRRGPGGCVGRTTAPKRAAPPPRAAPPRAAPTTRAAPPPRKAHSKASVDATVVDFDFQKVGGSDAQSFEEKTGRASSMRKRARGALSVLWPRMSRLPALGRRFQRGRW